MDIIKVAKRNKWWIAANVFVLLLLLALPYYIFEGKLFIGGDDTKLLYVYPLLFLKEVSFYSWYTLSSIGSYNPNQFSIPFLLIWHVISLVIPSKVVLDYLSFSLPQIIGLIYFQKEILELLPSAQKQWPAVFLGSLFYIFSPVLILWQLSVFLYCIWLIGLIPILLYYFTKYVKSGRLSNILIAMLYSTIFSISLYSVPWILGFVLPLGVGLISISLLYRRSDIITFCKRTISFFSILLLSQAFWLLPFVTGFINIGVNSYGGRVLSKQTASSFTTTVLPSLTGNIVYPLANLFQRRYAVDFGSTLTPLFTSYYDKLLILSIAFLVLLFAGIIFFKKVTIKDEQKVYLLCLISFAASLYFFTVNIGPLREVFLFLGHIPGFIMFRNFFDKFSIGFALMYGIIMTLSLVVVSRKYKAKQYIILGIYLLLILIFALPIKQIITRPLWQTKDVGTYITIPDEYSSFLLQLQKTVPKTSNILSLPYNIASYTFIKDPKSNNIYPGTSPVKIFTGIDDFSGDLSFPEEAGNMNDAIKNRDYVKLNALLLKYNINYIFITKNIPHEVLNGYLFKKDVIQKQDAKMLQAISGKKLLQSENDNYELYTTKQQSFLFNAQNVEYEEVNPITYKVYIHNITQPETLHFLQTFHSGWQLYLDKNPKQLCPLSKTSPQACNTTDTLVTKMDIRSFFEQPLFSSTHEIENSYSNRWVINPVEIKRFGKDYYTSEGKNGIAVAMTLYFRPQIYFYIGVFISLLTMVSVLLFYLTRERNILWKKV